MLAMLVDVNGATHHQSPFDAHSVGRCISRFTGGVTILTHISDTLQVLHMMMGLERIDRMRLFATELTASTSATPRNSRGAASAARRRTTAPLLAEAQGNPPAAAPAAATPPESASGSRRGSGGARAAGALQHAPEEDLESDSGRRRLEAALSGVDSASLVSAGSRGEVTSRSAA